MIWLLLIAFQIKHFLSDFPLQIPYMFQKYRAGKEYALPMAAHAGVHAGMTLVIASCFTIFTNVGHEKILLAAAVDFIAHFIIDRINANPSLLGKFKAVVADEFISLNQMANYEGNKEELLLSKETAKSRLKSSKYFWWALGWDQMMHHFTHYLIIYLLVSP